MDASFIYGLIAFSATALAWASGDHVRQKLGLLLQGVWATTAIAVTYMGFERAPALFPYVHTVAFLIVAWLGFRNRSYVALVVFVIYGSLAVTDLVAIILREQGTYTYYATVNVLFVAQLLTVGGSSAWLAIRNWADRGDQRRGLVRARR